MGRWISWIAGVALFLVFWGCQTIQPTKTPLEMASEPEPKLTLGPGDVLEIKFFYVPEINENLTVRPDGKISLQLVGELDVRGKTPLELKEELVRAYTGKLRTPEVTVIVRSLNERRVYVAGEVKTPGFLPLPGRLTVLEAIMGAGGFNLQTAAIKSVVVIRQKDGQHFGTVLNFQEVLGGRESRAFYLEPRDIVYVSRTMIVNINQWIDQYLNKIIPQVGLEYTRRLIE